MNMFFVSRTENDGPQRGSVKKINPEKNEVHRNIYKINVLFIHFYKNTVAHSRYHADIKKWTWRAWETNRII